MPRGVKRGPVEGEAEVVVRAAASPSHTTLLDDSPSQPISYHLLDHGYGATPKNQIRREAPTAPPKTSEVSLSPYTFIKISVPARFQRIQISCELLSSQLIKIEIILRERLDLIFKAILS